MPYRSLLLESPASVSEYVGLDLQDGAYNFGPDLLWDGNEIPVEDESFDCALATEVLEHCPEPESVLSEVFRVLRPSGFFFLTVPFLWPLHDVPGDYYRYTPFAVDRLLKRRGFDNICVRPMGGWDASLAQMLGLWARRRPMNRLVRTAISGLFLPVVMLLGKSGRVDAKDGIGMISGISGTCVKRTILNESGDCA